MRMRRLRFLGRAAKDPAVAIGDPRFDGWETVSTFEDQATAVAWRVASHEPGELKVRA